MVGLAVAADAPPGACATLSALEVPGSMAWTDAEVGAFAWVVRERTSYLEAPVTTYGSVPAVAVPSRPPSMTVLCCSCLDSRRDVVRVYHCGASAPREVVMREYGFGADNVCS